MCAPVCVFMFLCFCMCVCVCEREIVTREIYFDHETVDFLEQARQEERGASSLGYSV
jgi:hypothetical protein